MRSSQIVHEMGAEEVLGACEAAALEQDPDYEVKDSRVVWGQRKVVVRLANPVQEESEGGSEEE